MYGHGSAEKKESKITGSQTQLGTWVLPKNYDLKSHALQKLFTCVKPKPEFVPKREFGRLYIMTLTT